MATPKTFRGFSTFEAERTRQWTRYDIDLVQRDLLNHFYTHIGERVNRPDFGCAIWDMLAEPMTPQLREDMIAEAQRICREDPRVSVRTVNVFEYQNGIIIEIILDFIGLAVMQNFSVNFERGEELAFSGSRLES